MANNNNLWSVDFELEGSATWELPLDHGPLCSNIRAYAQCINCSYCIHFQRHFSINFSVYYSLVTIQTNLKCLIYSKLIYYLQNTDRYIVSLTCFNICCFLHFNNTNKCIFFTLKTKYNFETRIHLCLHKSLICK